MSLMRVTDEHHPCSQTRQQPLLMHLLTTVSSQKASVTKSSAGNLQPLWHKMQLKALIQNCLSHLNQNKTLFLRIQREHVQSTRKHWEPSCLCVCVCMWELLMVYCRWLMDAIVYEKKILVKSAVLIWPSSFTCSALHFNPPQHVRRMHLHSKVSPSVITSAAGWQSSNQCHKYQRKQLPVLWWWCKEGFVHKNLRKTM